ncbi:MAG TPA: cytochrome P450 [Actinomycetota bacterium]|jgi:cytochrome P450|nr:cytochrome P450 [Actinomycetota bacterium]
MPDRRGLSVGRQDVVDLTDPWFWTRDDAHETVARLRRAAPVHWQETAEGPLWSVLSYPAATAVLGDPDVFSSKRGSLLGTAPAATGAPAGAEKMMALCDPPRHRTLRDPVTALFSARHVSTLAARVHDLTVSVVERALDRRDVDFVRDVGAIVPMTMMCELMGVPERDREMVVGLCDEAFLGRTREARRAGHQRLLPYLFELAVERRKSPGEDVVSVLAGRDVEDGRLPLEEVVLNCDNIIVGGVQTVRHTAAMGMLALAEHPGAWTAFQSGAVDPATAVEELLRWTSVGLHVLRVAKRDTGLDGQRILAGDRVVVWTPAANRDEEIFPSPGRLDLSRHPNRHIAFGWGPHYCIGATLARLELVSLFSELARRVEVVEPLGPPTPNLSIINFGLESFPVHLRPRKTPPTAAARARRGDTR